MFRKEKSTDSAAPTETEAESAVRAADAAQARKGRATPTRREAEEARKQRLSGVGDNSKAAKRAQRTRDYEITTERQHGGPIKAYARDYTDRRMRAAELFIPFALLMFILMSVRTTTMQTISFLLYAVIILAVVIDSVLLVRGVRKGAAERFPGQPLGRLGLYALTRSIQFRRWRLPKPRLKRGEQI